MTTEERYVRWLLRAGRPAENYRLWRYFPGLALAWVALWIWSGSFMPFGFAIVWLAIAYGYFVRSGLAFLIRSEGSNAEADGEEKA